MAALSRSHTKSYRRSTVAVALSCILYEIKRDTGGNSNILPPSALNTLPLRVQWMDWMWVGIHMVIVDWFGLGQSAVDWVGLDLAKLTQIQL